MHQDSRPIVPSFFIFFNIFSPQNKIFFFFPDFARLSLMIIVLNMFPKVPKQEREAIGEVAHLLLEHTSGILKIGPGYCLSCGTHCDLEASHATLRKAGTAIKRYRVLLVLKIPWPDCFPTSHDCILYYRFVNVIFSIFNVLAATFFLKAPP